MLGGEGGGAKLGGLPSVSSMVRSCTGKNCSVPGVLVEVGANTGTHTVALARRAVAVGVEDIAFEPQPVVFQNLCANLALNGLHNVRAWPWTCGAQQETVFFARQDY